MGAFVPGAEDVPEVSTMARPTQTRHFGRAICFFRGLFGTSVVIPLAHAGHQKMSGRWPRSPSR